MQTATDEITIWMNYAGSKKLLTEEETLDIAKKIQTSEPGSKLYARYVNKLTEHNLRLVANIVSRFMRSKSARKWGSPETVDYLQVGAMGLRRAAELYDPTRGYRFSTYATPWIKSKVSRYNMNASSIFHIPENVFRDVWQYENYGYLKHKTQTEKTKEYCEELTKRVRSMQNPLYLDADLSKNDKSNGFTALNIIESHYQVAIDGVHISPEIDELLKLAELSDLQTQIIKASYVDDMSTKEIMELYDLPRSHIKSLKNSALKKLKEVLVTV